MVAWQNYYTSHSNLQVGHGHTRRGLSCEKKVEARVQQEICDFGAEIQDIGPFLATGNHGTARMSFKRNKRVAAIVANLAHSRGVNSYRQF
jgi:hypothetical protein